MKATIQEVTFSKEYEGKFGKVFVFRVKYDDKVGVYNSKYKDQKKFVAGKEAEFTEEPKTFKNQQGEEIPYTVIKPVAANGQSNFGKALNKEQARYSTMATSYVKDLIVSGRIDISLWEEKSKEVCAWMISMDKEMIN
jgi:hypothetical protein